MNQGRRESCPFIDADDPRCRSRFTIDHMSEAFGVCLGAYRTCPNFYRLLQLRPQRTLHMTVHGRPLSSTGS